VSQVFSVILDIMQRSCSGFVVRSDRRPRWSDKAESDGTSPPVNAMSTTAFGSSLVESNEIKTRLREVAVPLTRASDMV
jgi:hypothetical protein